MSVVNIYYGHNSTDTIIIFVSAVLHLVGH